MITDDVRRRIRLSLRRNPRQFDRQLARRFGVAQGTVAAIRAELGLEAMPRGRPAGDGPFSRWNPDGYYAVEHLADLLPDFSVDLEETLGVAVVVSAFGRRWQTRPGVILAQELLATKEVDARARLAKLAQRLVLDSDTTW